MAAIQLFCVIAGLGFVSAAFEARAQATLRGGPSPAAPSAERERPERDDDYRPAPHRKTVIPSQSAPVAKPKPPANSTYTAPPVYRERTERYYDSRPPQRQSTAPKSSPPAVPKTRPVKNAATPEPRDPALARCDDFKRRMEQVIREEQRGGDPARMRALTGERQKIYQEELKAGC